MSSQRYLQPLVLIVAFAVAAMPGIADDKKAKPEQVKFTEEEAKFVAWLAKDAELVGVMKAGLRVVDAADQPWPTKTSDLAEYLMKKTIEVAFDAPKVEQAIKDLDKLKCHKQTGEIQLFLAGKHTEVKGKPSAANKKYFEAMAKCYESKK